MTSNLMPLAATLVVLFYALGVAFRRSPLWYEWVAAALGAAFAVWFWYTELKRARRRRGR